VYQPWCALEELAAIGFGKRLDGRLELWAELDRNLTCAALAAVRLAVRRPGVGAGASSAGGAGRGPRIVVIAAAWEGSHE
jgi:hypothetical protein